MSKFKDYLLKQKDKEYELYLGYEEYLYENKIQNLSENDINEMEEGFTKSSTSSNFIVSNSNLKVANNTDYFPLQGA